MMPAGDAPNGFASATFDWMAAMSLNNCREEFLARKADYETWVKAPFVALLTELSATYGGTPKVFRPNRDIRFSSDKRPYKTNISGYLNGAAFAGYLELSLDGLMAATGYYQMAKDQLVRYRAALTGDDGEALGQELRGILVAARAEGAGLKTVPRGIAKDHPNADILGFTSITCSETLPADEVLVASLDGFAREVWDRARPLNLWLQAHVGPSQMAW